MTVTLPRHVSLARLALGVLPLGVMSCAVAVSFDEYSTRSARPPSPTEAGAADGPYEAAPPRGRVKQVAAGDKHACALLEDGQVRCWGEDYFGQLGDGARIKRATPITVHGVTGATAIAAGASQTCAIVANGEILCWGLNSSGELGDGMTSFPTEAVRVAGLAGASAVAVGAEHGCAIVASGDVMCWGSNHSFALGLPNPSMEARPHTPLPLPGVSGATAIASSSIYSCAIVAEGGVRCWGGYNGSTPQSVGNVSGAKALAVGSNHACAAVTDGEVRCWGPLSYGPSQPAVGVRGFSGATALAASGVTDADGFSSRACAIVEAGRVWCWARNVEAAPVDGLRPVLGLATGGSLPDDHTCVVLEGSGEVRCWGSSSYGQLGDGTIATTYIKTPVAVVGLP